MRKDLEIRRTPGGRRNLYLGIFLGVALVTMYQAVKRERANSTAGMPADEAAFVAAAVDARAAWLGAPNDLGRADMRADRAAALCRALPGPVADGWKGRILRIEPVAFPDYRGQSTAAIVIGLVDHVTVATPSAPLLNDPAMMVEAGSAIYATAATLAPGTAVVFSGGFFPNGADCVQEVSLTLEGSMTEPSFKIRLLALARK